MLSSIPALSNNLKQFLLSNCKIILASPISRNYYQSKNVNKKDDDKKNEIDENEFNKEKSFGTKNLEQLGMIKSSMSWPQYNRIIYPPMPDGKPMRNPCVHHMRNFIRYPMEKLWYPAFLV